MDKTQNQLKTHPLRNHQLVKHSFHLLLWSICIGGSMGIHIKEGSTKVPSISKQSIYLGMVDQIDPPWIVIVSEAGPTFYLSTPLSYSSLKEGEWVIYIASNQSIHTRIYPLNTEGIAQFKQRISQATQEKLNQLKQQGASSSFSLF